MAAFKIKHDKTKHLVQINTLDEIHKKFVSNFQNRKSQLPKKKKKLVLLQDQLNKIETADASTYTTLDIKRRSELKTEIQNLEEEIYDIENDLSELDYYFKIEDIVMDYYQITDTEDNTLYNSHPELCNTSTNTSINTNTKHDQLDQLNQLNRGKTKTKKVTKRRYKHNMRGQQTNILDFFMNCESVTENTETETDTETCEIIPVLVIPIKNKAELHDLYMMFIDNSLYNKKKIRDKIKKCNTCNIEKTLMHADGIYVCQKCGEAELVIVDSEKPNYKEAVTSDTKPGYPYKRINHLNEWLSQFQAKESIEIPDEIYNRILAELRKDRFTDLKRLGLNYTKKILKRLQLTQCYEHIAHIISKLSGIPPPIISRDTEEKIRLMFRQIQVPFEKYCPKDRTNFLSYSYVLHKFFQLLELDDFVKYFPLLKSREKLQNQDKIWEKICYELNWDFYPSV